MNTPVPNPARFDGHWLTPRQMAALLGIGADRLARLALAGRLPEGSVQREGRGRRRYEAGLVLAWHQQRTDRRRRP